MSLSPESAVTCAPAGPFGGPWPRLAPYLVALALLAGCQRATPVRDGMAAAAPSPLSGVLVGAFASASQPACLGLAGGDADGEPAPTTEQDRSIGLSWTHEPAELQVYRSTAVHFRVERMPAEHEAATCRWHFGDGSPVVDGCAVSHTFHGGQADQVVTLALEDGGWSWESTRVVPLERLEVTDSVDSVVEEGGQAIPEPLEPGAVTFRMVLVADSATTGGPSEDVRAAVGAMRRYITPELVIHLGGAAAPGRGDEGWTAAQQAIGAPLSADGVPVVWASSPTDRAEGAGPARPRLQLIDGDRYPERYSFTYKGAFFVVFPADGESGVSEETLAWLRDTLGKARVYDARFVISYLPLHKFAEVHVGSLDKKFRLYELFLRARVTAMFSAGYRVFYKGRYGALPVVSVGALTSPGGTLSGTDFAQPPSFVVVDVAQGSPERIFAVEGPAFDRRFDETLLPESVEVYTR